MPIKSRRRRGLVYQERLRRLPKTFSDSDSWRAAGRLFQTVGCCRYKYEPSKPSWTWPLTSWPRNDVTCCVCSWELVHRIWTLRVLLLSRYKAGRTDGQTDRCSAVRNVASCGKGVITAHNSFTARDIAADGVQVSVGGINSKLESASRNWPNVVSLSSAVPRLHPWIL